MKTYLSVNIVSWAEILPRTGAKPVSWLEMLTRVNVKPVSDNEMLTRVNAKLFLSVAL